MSLFEMSRQREIALLALGLILGPPLSYVISCAGLFMVSPSSGFSLPADIGEVPNYLLGVFLLGYLKGFFPALIAVLLLFAFLSKSAALHLLWALVTACLSTNIWYCVPILVNSRALTVGVVASLVSLMFWILVELVWREKAVSS